MLKTAMPKQDNFFDCGVFVLRYADVVVQATLPDGGWRRLTAARVEEALRGGRGLGFPKRALLFTMADIAFLRMAVSDVIARCRTKDKGNLVALSALRPERGDAGDNVLRATLRETWKQADKFMEDKGSHLRVASPGLLFATADKARAAAEGEGGSDSDVEEVPQRADQGDDGVELMPTSKRAARASLP